MKTVQDRLLGEATHRLCATHPEYATGRSLASIEELLGAYAVATTNVHDQDTVATVVIGRFDLAAWVRGTCDFAMSVAPWRAAAWRRSFTRTIFLAGNPTHLGRRFEFDHIADDESTAWTSPGPSAESAGLRRLLKLFVGTAPLRGVSNEEITVSGEHPLRRPALRRDLDIAVAGCTVADNLVHLNHLLVEAVFDGLIGPGDWLTLCRVPRLSRPLDRYVALRVATEQAAPGRLRAFAGLTEGRSLAE